MAFIYQFIGAVINYLGRRKTHLEVVRALLNLKKKNSKGAQPAVDQLERVF